VYREIKVLRGIKEIQENKDHKVLRDCKVKLAQ
jgi:hypothetical protein